jgi:hypothetical protein
MSKEKKPPKEPDYTKIPVLPPKLAEFVQENHGVTTDVLLKLLESFERVDPDIEIARRRTVDGKPYSKLVGGRKAFGPVGDAVKYTQERLDERHEKSEKIHELIDDVDWDGYMIHLGVRDTLYPQPLAPVDIADYVDSAGKKLEALDRERAEPPKRVYSARDEVMLDVITIVKKDAPLRLARRLAEWQKMYILTRTPEELEAAHKEWLRVLRGDPTEEERLAMEEAARLAEEEAEAEAERLAEEAALRNFDDLAELHTLLDDVADLIKNNPEAAAAIIRLWIGNTAAVENK